MAPRQTPQDSQMPRTLQHDVASVRGFIRAVECILSLKPGALFWSGLPCQTFIWMSRASYQPSPENQFFGLEDNAVLKVHNCLLLHWVLLSILAFAWRWQVVVEQPRSSVLPFVAHVEFLVEVCGRAWREP